MSAAAVEKRAHGKSPYLTALELVLTRRNGGNESISFKQSWKDGHWYCDGLTLSPQTDETLEQAFERFLVLRQKIEAELSAPPPGDDDVPF